MKKIGLTGSIGAGKSTIAALLRTRGVPVHDADAAVHEIYARPETLAWLDEKFFGVVNNSQINRARLAEMIYADAARRKDLEDYIHPLVRHHRDDFTQSQAAHEKIVVFDIPLLFETDQDAEMDETWLVTAPIEIRRTRALTRMGMTPERFETINAAQMPETEKCARATYVIENIGTVEELEQKVAQLLEN